MLDLVIKVKLKQSAVNDCLGCHNQIHLLNSDCQSCLLWCRLFLMVQSEAVPYFHHHMSKAAEQLTGQDGVKVTGLWWCKIHPGRGSNVWEKEECRKTIVTDCPRVFLEAPACLTHCFSYRGPMCAAAPSGLVHDENTEETDWKWKAFFTFIPRTCHICSVYLSPCRCH